MPSPSRKLCPVPRGNAPRRARNPPTAAPQAVPRRRVHGGRLLGVHRQRADGAARPRCAWQREGGRESRRVTLRQKYMPGACRRPHARKPQSQPLPVGPQPDWVGPCAEGRLSKTRAAAFAAWRAENPPVADSARRRPSPPADGAAGGRRRRPLGDDPQRGPPLRVPWRPGRSLEPGRLRAALCPSLHGVPPPSQEPLE